MDQETRKTILAVDDSVTQLKIFETFLSPHYNLSLVKSAAEALGLIEKMDFDLILLDIEMPDMSGFEFLHEIRKNTRYMTKPVIIISNHTEPDFLAHANSSSAIEVLTKPVESRDLLAAIEMALTMPEKKPFDF
ncbi:MAG: response regulator [Treponema sp.]|jgi:CheY-like chemotaxis protein|nr:response regulator [Treponema sp.]